MYLYIVSDIILMKLFECMANLPSCLKQEYQFWLDQLNWEYFNMKKHLSNCSDCGEDSSILTQVSSGPEVILLCSDCYNLKYSKEVQNEIYYAKKKKN